MDKNKLIRIKINTPKGERSLTFMPIKIESGICCLSCPYENVCDKLRDPRDPEDSKKTFLDFCSSITLNEMYGQEIEVEETSEENEVICSYVPVKGTIEENLSDVSDSIAELIKTNPLVSISSVIDGLCSGGWCELYTKEHTNCNCNNKACVLRTLFSK